MSKRKTKKASERLKSIQEVNKWLMTMKKSDGRTSALRYLKILFNGLANSQEHVLILTLKKSEFLEWQHFKANKAKFQKWEKENQQS